MGDYKGVFHELDKTLLTCEYTTGLNFFLVLHNNIQWLQKSQNKVFVTQKYIKYEKVQNTQTRQHYSLPR